MRLEPRYATLKEGEKPVLRGIAMISEDAGESALLDLAFGNQVGADGLIGERVVECRLSDGWAEHYVYLNALRIPPAAMKETVGSVMDGLERRTTMETGLNPTVAWPFPGKKPEPCPELCRECKLSGICMKVNPAYQGVYSKEKPK